MRGATCPSPPPRTPYPGPADHPLQVARGQTGGEAGSASVRHSPQRPHREGRGCWVGLGGLSWVAQRSLKDVGGVCVATSGEGSGLGEQSRGLLTEEGP